MKMLPYIYALLLLAQTAFAQAEKRLPPPLPPPIIETMPPLIDDETCFCFSDMNEEFPGGEMAFMQYLKQNIKLPMITDEMEITNFKMLINFTIAKDGRVENVYIKRSVHPVFDKIVLREVKNLPSWSPKLHLFEKIQIEHTLPIAIRID